MAIAGDHNSRTRSGTAASLQATSFPANALCDMTFSGKYICPLKLLSVLKEEYANISTLSARKVVEMTDKVEKIKESVACCMTVNLKCRKKSTSPLRVSKMCQMWIFLLVILFSTSQVVAKAKTESEEIGSCRFDMISLASLSCVEVDGNWRPPSVACCNALVHAVDTTGSDGGACCLCRYISRRYSQFALATSYVICKGKDSHFVSQWTSVPRSCSRACRPRNGTSPARKDFPIENLPGIGSNSLRVLWIAAVAAAFFAILLVWFCYNWWRKPVNPSESRPSNLRPRRGLPSEAPGDIRSPNRHSPAQRRTSKSSPNS